MVDRLAQWDVRLYCTDQWATYASVIPQDKLVHNKTTTHDIERNHCRRRHWFGRFKRKSIIISKAKAMVDPTFKGSDCPCRLFGLRILHTTRSRGPVHHR